MTALPIYLKSGELIDPPPIYYLVTGNGNFLVKRTDLYSSITPVSTLVGLDRQEPHLEIHLPRISNKLMQQIYSFFQEVYNRWEGEAIVFLFYHPDKSIYRIGVPPQTLFRGYYHGGWRTQRRIAYGYVPRPSGYLKIGDAHSHADFPAFFSCADDQDDAGQEGLHLVMGNLHYSRPDLSASFVVGGHRFSLPVAMVTEDFSHASPPPEEWLQQITYREDNWESPSWRRKKTQVVSHREGG